MLSKDEEVEMKWALRNNVSRRARWALALAAVMTMAACHGAAGSPSAAAAGGGVTAGGKAGGGKLFQMGGSRWGLTWSYNPFNPHFFGNLYDYALLPLAINKPGTIGSYIPELASSWSVTPSTVTIHLRKGANWQNGKPVTSQDVITTLLLEGTDGSTIWSDVTGVRASGAHTVVLSVRPGVPAALVLHSALAAVPVPAATYGRFVVPGLEKDLLGYAKLSNAKAAPASPQGKAVAAVFAKLEKFSPTTAVGDGPFKLASVTSAAAIETKWAGFWAASKIHIPGIEFRDFASVGAAFPAFFSHRLDFGGATMPYAIVQRWTHTSNAHYLTVPGYGQEALLFNNRRYPFNLLGVRQAIAYVINRPKMVAVAGGGHPKDHAATYPTGLLSSVERQWLTPAQIKSLNPYAYDPAKATALLDSLHFHKQGGRWIMPNGKPFTVSLGVPAPWGSAVAAMQSAASMLSGFGIKASVNGVELPGYWTYQYQGNFQIDWGWGGNGGSNPLAGAAAVLHGNNYRTSGPYKGDKGIGFGPMATVPGLGKVNVPQVVAAQAAKVGPGPQMKKLTLDWVRLINQQLPYIGYAQKYQPIEYSTAHFADWPPQSSSLWNIFGGNFKGAFVAMLEAGYVRPKG